MKDQKKWHPAMLRASQQRRRDAKKISLGVLAEGCLNEIKISSRRFHGKIPQIKRNK
jgi:hypothetical protein